MNDFLFDMLKKNNLPDPKRVYLVSASNRY